MNSILTSWKTTVPGVLLIAYVIVRGLKTGEWMGTDQVVALLSSVGLLAARDSNVTSEQAKAR